MFDFLSQKFSGIFSRFSSKSISQKELATALDELYEGLLEADVPYQLAQEFIDSLRSELAGQKVAGSLKPGEQIIKIVYDKLVSFFGGKHKKISFNNGDTVMVLGLQGSGKTTSIAKLIAHVEKESSKDKKTKQILVSSVDFTRPAAIDQLEQLVQATQATFFRASSSTPQEALQEIKQQLNLGKYDLLFLDTAGRLHIDNALLLELKELHSLLQPKHTFLVLDAMTGQESLRVAQAFDQTVRFDAAILTKMDSSARAGAAFSFCYALKKPIAFVGTGEKIDDFDLFYPDRVANRLLGMGDLQTLLERAEEKIRQDEQQKMEASFNSGRFTLEDFAQQLQMMGRMGSLAQIMKYMPGAGQVSPEQLEQGERELKRFKALISSMTPKERHNPRLIDGSRKARIAQGAGLKPQDVSTLLSRFDQAQQYAKLIKKMGPFKQMFR